MQRIKWNSTQEFPSNLKEPKKKGCKSNIQLLQDLVKFLVNLGRVAPETTLFPLNHLPNDQDHFIEYERIKQQTQTSDPQKSNHHESAWHSLIAKTKGYQSLSQIIPSIWKNCDFLSQCAGSGTSGGLAILWNPATVSNRDSFSFPRIFTVVFQPIGSSQCSLSQMYTGRFQPLFGLSNGFSYTLDSGWVFQSN